MDGMSETIYTIFYPFPNKPLFLHICSISLPKTLWEKGEIAHNFSHIVFYAFEEHSAISSNLKLSSANCLISEESKICYLEKS